ncbi:GPI mannosyltransferase 1 [Symbiodinium microadriaticum]|uniref:GPI mannosyltransferase 1 n=1 Tax=Symbiodinium microadriaticum TaxID=2951 RepID=A0A1Q9F6H0_SYMMI|nr:GPI mannosyltransferase 1 [Symbiodinium microadriaticum]
MDATLDYIGQVPPRSLILAAVFLRLILIAVAEVQDYLAEMPYTDVDYQVFTDAAESIALGLSPYEGRTALLAAEATRYRYTPLLAFLLLPNVWLHKAWGKLLFSGLDVAAACLLQGILQHKRSKRISLSLALWLFNPFCFTISTRGSGESVVVLLIYAVIYFLEVRKNWPLAALCYGIAVHWRIYPIVNALPIALFLLGFGRARDFLQLVGFGCVTAAVLLGLGLACYKLYGHEFIECSYLHHSSRRDPQHNFSVYFYPVALHLEGTFNGMVPDLARFAAVPQILLCAWLGFAARDELPVAMLLQTLAFVATNKVLTAQYFVWWLCLVPFVLPKLESCSRLTRCMLVWMAAEVHWLLWAYLLEFRQLPVRPAVWVASCLFLLAHINVLCEVRRGTGPKAHAA